MNGRAGPRGRAEPRWSLKDEELLWRRLFAMLDEVQTVIARLESAPDGGHESTLAVLEPLRADLVAVLRLSVDVGSSAG